MKTSKQVRKSLGQLVAEAVAKREAQTGQRHVYAFERRGSRK